jgi:hypothetical protein
MTLTAFWPILLLHGAIGSLKNTDAFLTRLLSKSGLHLSQAAQTSISYLKFRAGEHVIFYRVDGDAIIIIRILHGRMDSTRHLPNNE